MPEDQNHYVGPAICFPLRPFPTESARGYIARVADHNVHELHLDALHHAGVDLKDVLAGRVDAALLDRIYGLDPGGWATLWPQVHGAKGPSIVLVHGVELPSRIVRHHRRRVSVAGLRKSLHHRHAWTIEALGFCPESWDVLIERCPGCGHKFAWGNGAFWCCDACGADLRQFRSVRIRREHRPALTVLSDLFSTDVCTREAACRRLPSFLQNVPLRCKVEFIRLLGRLFDRFGPRHGDRPTGPCTYSIVMWVGLDVLLHLDERVAALAEPSSQARAWQSELRAQLTRHAHGPRDFNKAARALLEMLQPGFTSDVEGRVLRLGHAARQLRIATTSARQLVDLGLLPSCSTLGGGMRQHDLLARDAVDHLQAQLSDRISLSNLCAKTHVAVKIIVGLEQAGYLRTVDNEVTGLLFKEVQFHRSALDELAALKHKVRRRDPHDPGCVRLGDLFAAMGIGFKPWIRAIVEAAQAGHLGAPEPSVMRRATLNVSLDWALQIARGKNAWACQRDLDAESINLVDAEEYLNTLPKDTSCLIAHGQLQRGGAGVTAQSVRRCARLFISTREVGARAGVESDKVAGLAARAGVARPYRSGSFWPRDRIEAALDLPPSGSAAAVLRALSTRPVLPG